MNGEGRSKPEMTSNVKTERLLRRHCTSSILCRK